MHVSQAEPGTAMVRWCERSCRQARTTGPLQHATSARDSHQYWQEEGNKQAQAQQLCSKAHRVPWQMVACMSPTQLCSKPRLAISSLLAKVEQVVGHI